MDGRDSRRILLSHTFNVYGDHQVFLGRHDKDCSVGDLLTDLLDAVRRGLIARRIEIDAEAFETGENLLSCVWIVLADAPCEDDGIEPAEQPAEASDGTGHASGEYLQGKSGACVSVACGFADGLHAIGHAAEGCNAGCMIQEHLDCGDCPG